MTDAKQEKSDSAQVANSHASVGMYRAVRFLSIVVCRVYFRMTIEGKENIPATGPFVLAPIHRSNLDTLVASTVSSRFMRFMAKSNMFSTKPGAWFIGSLGGFPVHRGSADREALTLCTDILKGGQPVVLFPEGTRQSGPLIGDIFDGAAYVAAKMGVPIVPVGIGGSERAMKKGSPLVRPVKIHVVIGKPILPAEKVNGRVPRHAVKELTATLHEELQILFDQAQVRAG